MIKKLKVVWICDFSNSNIRSKLPLSPHYDYGDRVPWVSQMINQFKSFPDIELHVISTHKGLKKSIFAFHFENINYYFFRYPFVIFKTKSMQLWVSRLNKVFLFLPNMVLIKRIFNNYIHFTPDIINLIGSEQPHYSPGVLAIKHIPVLITVQGIYSDPEYLKTIRVDRIRYYFERKIIRNNKYYVIGAPFFSDLILKLRKDAVFFWNFLPRDMPEISSDSIHKEFDFVFFSRIIPVKGIEDLIDAMSLVKKAKPSVSLLVMGPVDTGFLSFLEAKVKDLDLGSNITFLGYQSTMEELHRQASKARFYVLPARQEALAGSVIESMYLGLPVVTTNVGGLPYLNKDGETVLMTEPNDINGFASNMIRLLQEPELAERLIPAARAFVVKEFNHFVLCRKFVAQYQSVIDHYHKGKQIDKRLLFNSSNTSIEIQ